MSVGVTTPDTWQNGISDVSIIWFVDCLLLSQIYIRWSRTSFRRLEFVLQPLCETKCINNSPWISAPWGLVDAPKCDHVQESGTRVRNSRLTSPRIIFGLDQTHSDFSTFQLRLQLSFKVGTMQTYHQLSSGTCVPRTCNVACHRDSQRSKSYKRMLSGHCDPNEQKHANYNNLNPCWDIKCVYPRNTNTGACTL